MKLSVNSNDKLFSEFRNLNFSRLGPLLNKKAKEIDEYYKTRHGAQTVSQIRDFMKKLSTTQQEHNSLRIHTNIAEKILKYTKEPEFRQRLEAEQSLLAGTDPDASQNYIEECINKKEPLVKVLRLLMLFSLTSGGVKPKQLEFFKREIIQTYGFEYIFTLNNLEKIGLIRKNEGKASFPFLRKALRLIVEEIDEGNPSDIAYVYSGYAPLSCRLIQQAIRPGGWKSLDELMRMLPGPTFEEVQQLPSAVIAGAPAASSSGPVTLVFYIGGCTFTEIAALRFLSQMEQSNTQFIVATTKLINGNSITDTLFEHVAESA